MAVRIGGVEKASPAEKAGLGAGMELLSADGHEIHDGLDYEFYTAGAQVRLVVRSEGQERTIEVNKQEYQPLGCVFESYLIDKQHHCNNRCVFCFIDQLPKGMRAPLYFKDDDERLSFLFGNYITLTNLSQREVQRIIEMKISPVNISVHTVNPPLRNEMMGNRFAGEALSFIPQLAKAGIPMNFQLVLCPGVNDGNELRRSIEWLAAFRPAAASVAVVPVGLTRHREGLPLIEPYDNNTAKEQLDILLEYGDAYVKETGTRFVYPSDEWFLLAGVAVPEADFYDGYPQLENGVGMWRLAHDEFMQALAETVPPKGAHAADIVVGTLAAPLFEELAKALEAKFPHIKLHVHAIENDFFGRRIGVTGLLTGRDIIAQMKGKMHSGTLLLPSLMLRREGDVLLDDVAPDDIAQALGVKVQVVPQGGGFLLAAVLEE